jgi:hypothetical protein
VRLELDSDSLVSAARRLAKVSEDADGTLGSFQGAVDAHAGCFGEDILGAAIAAVHEGAMAMVLNCVNTNLDAAEAYGDILTAFATETDAIRADALRQIRDVDARPSPAG